MCKAHKMSIYEKVNLCLFLNIRIEVEECELDPVED